MPNKRSGGLKVSCKSEVSVSWPKLMFDFSYPTRGNIKSHTCQASQETASLPTPDLGHSQCITVSEGSCSQGLRSCSYIHLHSQLDTFVPRSLYLRSSVRCCSRDSAKAFLWVEGWGMRGNLEDIFLQSDLGLSPFHSQPSPYFSWPLPPSYPLAGAVCQACLGSEMTLTSLLIHLILDWADMPFRGEGRHEGTGIFSGLASCLYYHSKQVQASLLLSFGACFNL